MRFSRESLSDQIALHSTPSRLRKPAFAVINGLQGVDAKPGEQVLGTAVALMAMCQSANINLDGLMTKARSIMGDVEGPFTAHLQSVRDYAANELLKGDR